VNPTASFIARLVAFGLLSALAACEKRPASWEYISPVLFEPNCATSSCHSRAAAADGLDFSDAERGYRSLTGLSATIDGKSPARRAFVTPYQPQQSRLIQMLRARNAPRMPPDRPMPEADILLVEEWILNGARQHATAAPTFDASTGGDASAGGDATGGDAAAD
jgi:hypothetical protein